MIRILLADDHRVFADGLKMIFEHNPKFEIVGIAENGHEVLESTKTLSPDLVLLDINMPALNGVETAEKLLNQYPKLKIIMLSMHQEAYYTAPLFEMGVHGYLLKNTSKTELFTAIEKVIRGKKYFSEDLIDHINERKEKLAQQESALTDREVQILQGVAEGLTSLEISQQLMISVYTVDTHRKNMMRKSGSANLMQLVNWGVKNEFIKLR